MVKKFWLLSFLLVGFSFSGSGKKSHSSVNSSFNASKFEAKKFKGWENREYILKNLKDGKKKVLVFWATWCAPCQKEMPMMLKELSWFKKNNIDLYLINVNEGDYTFVQSNALKWMKKKNLMGLKNNIYFDPQMDFFSELGMGAIPLNVVYQRKPNESPGKIKWINSGEINWHSKKLKKEILALD